MLKQTQKTRPPKLRIKKDDTVYVLTGKDRGATGKVLSVDPVKQRAVVEKVNLVKRHRKETRTGGGGIQEMPAPIHVSNLVVVCPHCKSHTRPRKKTIEREKQGRRKRYHVRVCRKCNELLDQI